jgi:hypothetical protein
VCVYIYKHVDSQQAVMLQYHVMQLNMNDDKQRYFACTYVINKHGNITDIVTDAWAVQFCCNTDERTSGAVSNRIFSEPDPFGCDAAFVDAASSSSGTRNR